MQLDGMRSLARLGLFVALIAVELGLAGSMSSQPSIRGYIEIREYAVSSPHKGIIRKIDVTLGQTVNAGQRIAEVEASPSAGSAGTEPHEAHQLQAPADGIVESIDARPGDAIAPSTTVATVVAADTRHVVACIPESRIGDVEVGNVAEVRPAIGGDAIQGAVESLTPAIATLPERCQSPLGKKASYGRLAVIALDQAASGVPGQSQLIAFGSTRHAVTAMAAKVVSDAGSEISAAPKLIDIPPEITSTSAFEASGLVWVARLDRYVVISDDTGRDDTHPPWLFTMSRTGVVDATPIVVEGVGQLDDLESITAGNGDALWLASSQSLSDKGNRPRSREVLARVVPSERGYKLDARVHLVSLLEAAPESVRRALGVVDTKQLDIEGMAYRRGALYIGLKTPVDVDRNAIIWRIGAPDRLLQGDLAGAEITLWGKVHLEVEVEGRRVPGGVADMMFVSDTQLLVTATASGSPAKHQASALYAVAATGGVLRATRLREFPELKAEGIAASPDPHRLAIVFDRGHHAPMWLEIEMPGLQQGP